jgi:tetratricopeptide (TPR) repeat protein
LQKAIELNPSNASAWEHMGKYYMIVGEYDKAERTWFEAIQIDDNLFYRYQFALCKALQSKYDEAIEIYFDIIEKNDEFVAAYQQLGIVYYLQKNFGFARKYLQRALGLEPENGDTRYHLGLVYLALNENQKAITEFERVLLFDPENIKVKVDLGILYMGATDYNNALDLFTDVLKTDAANQKALYYKAHALKKLGKEDEALKIFKLISENQESEYAKEAAKYI